MKVASTRSPYNVVSFREALFEGLASDGGLYVPVENYDLRNLYLSLDPKKNYSELAAQMLIPLFNDEIPQDQINKICQDAFFFSPQLKKLDENFYILELFHGPSCAFKDFGASFLATAMSWFLQNENKRSIILTATSGDTGSAVAHAFYQKPNIDVVILYPSGRVSPLQENQLTTLGHNIHALEVKGSFDDCQRLVKEAFLDNQLADLPLTSANSINLGRLIPQSLYYIWSFVQLRDSLNDDLIFTVPSGNFGNLTAGVYAWKWGLPVFKFIAATNINDVVPEYLKTQRFRPRPSLATYSNAMDVGNPSNFERLEVLFQKNPNLMGALISAESVTDHQTLETIKKIWTEHHYDICPHTAVGVKASLDYQNLFSEDGSCHVVLATAHPAKFVEVVQMATGREPKLPEQLQKLSQKQKQSLLIEAELDSLKEFLGSLR